MVWEMTTHPFIIMECSSIGKMTCHIFHLFSIDDFGSSSWYDGGESE